MLQTAPTEAAFAAVARLSKFPIQIGRAGFPSFLLAQADPGAVPSTAPWVMSAGHISRKAPDGKVIQEAAADHSTTDQGQADARPGTQDEARLMTWDLRDEIAEIIDDALEAHAKPVEAADRIMDLLQRSTGEEPETERADG